MSDDARIEQAVQRVLAEMMPAHDSGYIAWRGQVAETLDDHGDSLELIGCELFGEPEEDIDGQIVRDGGIKRDVKDIKDQLGNGGVKIRLPVTVWSAIIITTGTFVTAMITLIVKVA